MSDLPISPGVSLLPACHLGVPRDALARERREAHAALRGPLSPGAVLEMLREGLAVVHGGRVPEPWGSHG